jgi:hypothetical protein
MDTRATVSSLPPLYAPWVEEILGGPVPEERHATCATCAMCEPHAATAATASMTRFDPTTKCCTYTPGLPNFLVGAILSDDDPGAAAGRESVRKRIARCEGVTPLGLQTPLQDAVIYKYAAGELFGRHGGLRCPHYVSDAGGLCGIWRHRNSVCATWFCKHEHGAVGQGFWRALLQLLGSVERQLALWCAIELGQGVDTLGSTLLPYYQLMPNSRFQPQQARAPERSGASTRGWTEAWGDRFEEFYVEAGRLAAPLRWSQVKELCGPTLGVEIKMVRKAQADLQRGGAPARLRYNAISVVSEGAGIVGVAGHSEDDMLPLPEGLVEELGRFDGRQPAEKTAATIAEASGVALDAGTIQRFVEYRILVPMHETPAVTVEHGQAGTEESGHGD